MAFNQWCLGDYERVALGLNIPSQVSKSFANGIYSSITERKNTLTLKTNATFGRGRDGTVVRALAFHQCGPGSNSGVEAICGLSLLLVLSLAHAPRGFSPCTPVFLSHRKPGFSNSNSTRNQVDEEPLSGCASKSCIN